MSNNKQLVITLTSDLFTDKHQLKIYKQDNTYILTEQKRVKKYYDHGIKIIYDDITIYQFIINFKTILYLYDI